jgi:hypothetical protein
MSFGLLQAYLYGLILYVGLVVGLAHKPTSKGVSNMATQPAVQVPAITKTQVNTAIKWLHAMGAKLTNRLGYNAYVISMALNAGTQAQINALAQTVAKLQGSNLPSPIPAMYPCMHMGYKNVHSYFVQQQNPSVMGLPFTTLQPYCVTHGQQYSKCSKTCAFGLYVHKANQYMHILVAQGMGSKAKPKAQAKAQAQTPTQTPTTQTPTS